MTEPNQPHNTGEKLIDAYNRMLHRVKEALAEVEKDTGPALQQAIETAKEKAEELGEITREEAEKVAKYLQRDIQDAAEYLAGPEGDELADWLRFDVELIEEQLLSAFLSVADQTSLELMKLNNPEHFPVNYHTGEVTGIGTLLCTECGKAIHFKKTGHIPPCPECKNTSFLRKTED